MEFQHNIPQLRVTGLCLRRGGRDVVRDLNFTAPAGRLVWLKGRNGAGKTTLLRALAGLLKPQSGRILWNGRDIADEETAYKSDLAWLGHKNALSPSLTIQENLRYLLWDEATAPGLEQVRHAPVRFLSEGQRQRVALAALLASAEKNIWLLDEPFAHLDADGAAMLRAALAARVEAGRITVLSSHQELGLAAEEVALS